MVKHDDPSRTAAEFLQLWQEHITKQMTDPATIHAMLSAMQNFASQQAAHDATTRRPAAAPAAHDDAIRRLSRRIDQLERTVAKLSARLDAAKNPTRKKPRKLAAAKPKIQRRKPKMVKLTKRKSKARKK